MQLLSTNSFVLYASNISLAILSTPFQLLRCCQRDGDTNECCSAEVNDPPRLTDQSDQSWYHAQSLMHQPIVGFSTASLPKPGGFPLSSAKAGNGSSKLKSLRAPALGNALKPPSLLASWAFSFSIPLVICSMNQAGRCMAGVHSKATSSPPFFFPFMVTRVQKTARNRLGAFLYSGALLCSPVCDLGLQHGAHLL